MAPGPESVWTNDHFHHSDLQVFALVSMTCFRCFSSQSSSQTSFQTPPGNHSFLLQPQLSPLATFILYLHTPCLQVKTTSALCLLPKRPSITRLSCDRGRIETWKYFSLGGREERILSKQRSNGGRVSGVYALLDL